MIVLIGLMMSINTEAGEFVKTPVQDFVQTDMEFIFEIKTAKFEKITLDCQSFFNGMNFYEKGEVKTNIHLSSGLCNEMYDFFATAKVEKTPVCIGLDSEAAEVLLTYEMEDCE